MENFDNNFNTPVALSKDEKTFGMLCHLSALVGFIIPLGNLIGPLVIWMLKKDEFPFVNDQGKESLNFQISMTIYFVISFILMIILIGILLAIALALAEIILVIIASVKANEGTAYRYPVTIKFIK